MTVWSHHHYCIVFFSYFSPSSFPHSFICAFVAWQRFISLQTTRLSLLLQCKSLSAHMVLVLNLNSVLMLTSLSVDEDEHQTQIRYHKTTNIISFKRRESHLFAVIVWNDLKYKPTSNNVLMSFSNICNMHYTCAVYLINFHLGCVCVWFVLILSRM